MLEGLGDGIWTVSVPLRLAGVDARTRSTVVRLADGGLWVHAPCRLDAALEGEVRALGSVEHLVAPNLFHHLYLNQWARAFPGAKLHLAPGLARKRADLPASTELTDVPDAAWRGTLEQVCVLGAPKVNEVAFFHPKSRTLILTDLMFHAGEARGLLDRAFWGLNGVLGRPGRSLLGKLWLKSPGEAHAAIETIRGWDFDRILLAHRDMVPAGGKRVFEDAFRGV